MPFKPGQSGNPAGRPKGSLNTTTEAAKAVLVKHTPELIEKAVQMALDGNETMLKVLIERILPRADKVLAVNTQINLNREKAPVQDMGSEMMRTMEHLLALTPEERDQKLREIEAQEAFEEEQAKQQAVFEKEQASLTQP